MAPFAIVAPLVGPAIDRIRGGRRFMIVLATALRAVVCVYMVSHVDDLFLFPSAFLILVLGKAYGIAKAALVPTVVDDETQLVRANSRLSLISGVVGLVVGGLAALIVKFIGPEAALVLRGDHLGIRVDPGDTALARGGRGRTAGHRRGGRATWRGHRARRRGDGVAARHRRLSHLHARVRSEGRRQRRTGASRVGDRPRRAACGGLPEVGTGHPATAPTWHFGAVLVAGVAGALLGAR